MTALPVIDNKTARRHFLHRHLLAGTPRVDLAELVTRLGFVQVDSINTVARAHDLILWARRQTYRPKDLRRAVDQDRSLFEHWTHDASVIPTAFYPYWRLKFARDRDRLRSRWSEWRRDGFIAKFDEVLDQIAKNGPVCSAEVGADEQRSSGGWWDWHPSKTALEYLWRSGALAVCHREGFRKYYDLAENVLPDAVLRPTLSEAETIDWACSAALDRLGFATSGELAAFWDLITPAEAKTWCQAALQQGRITEALVAHADKSQRRVFTLPDLPEPPEPSGRMRVLSPFDPMIRDRKRCFRLFGYHYRIEIFVPEPKRVYGYYVFPLLEGDRLIGRIDMKCDRATETLNIRAVWPEPGVKFGSGRQQRLLAELSRIATFTQSRDVVFAPDFMRPAIS